MTTLVFEVSQVSTNVWSITENDVRNCRPLSYLIVGEEKALLIDTGCGYGNMYLYVRKLPQIASKKIIVVNTHNHPEQTGGNQNFSTTGKWGLSLQVEDLCASKKNKYYTRLLESNWHWEVGTYKVTRWLNDGDEIHLGPKENPINNLKIFWTPGHTPDSLVVWYGHDARLFLGDLFYRFSDIYFNYKYTDIREYESSVRRILLFINSQPNYRDIRYSSAKNDVNNFCLPQLKHYHRFLLAIFAGTHTGLPLRIDEAEGWRYETRDKAMRIVLGRRIVQYLSEAREKAQQRE
ncbi:unnamed protein product [Auanema sp. JU1783]|nr:unnamed protein product [Auanema sp. JU1783]